MKRIGIYIIIYNLFCLSVLTTEWYSKIITMYIPFYGIIKSERYNFMDFIDTPFYLVALYVILFCRKKITYMQKVSIICLFPYLVFKIVNMNLLNLGYKDFMFWNLFFLLIVPIVLFLESKINYDKFNK